MFRSDRHFKCITRCLDIVCGKVEDLRDVKAVKRAIRAAISSKQYGNEDFISDLVTEACSMLYYFNIIYIYN